MKAKPLVCICIPNYNNEGTISKTLESIINQTYENIIIKVFDNASTDKSIEILKEYEKKYNNIQIFQNEKNIGGEANFTKCIEHMEGEFSAIYHSDDIYHKDIIEKEVDTLENNDISAVFTNANIIDANDKIINKITIPSEFINENAYVEFSLKDLIKSNMKYDNFLVCPTVMARTDIYKNIIKSWDGSKYKSATDISIWLRFATFKKIGLITEELINYRYSMDSFSFRRLKTRVERKDYFLVMDDFLSRDNIKELVSDKDYRYYNFLKFKDDAVIQRNSIINGIIVNNSIRIFDIDIIRVALSSKKYFIYYWVGVFLKILNYKNFAAKVVRMGHNSLQK